MSLSFSFRLTPAQTDFLLRIAFGHYRQMDGYVLLPDIDTPHFVSIGRNLIDKGLVSHSNDRTPAWMPTDTGIHVAEMIVSDARKMVALENNRKPLPKVVARNAKQAKA